MHRIWAGIDAGKRSHHCVVLDEHGNVLLSTKVDNDETAQLELIRRVAGLAVGGQACWATDLNAGGAAMLIALLAAHDQHLLHRPGRIVHYAAATYRGDGKTDAKDARIIADQARMRTDLQPVGRPDPIATDLRLLTAHRTDVVCDRVRAINRLRATMLEYFPALERAFDYSKGKAALTLLSGYQTPEALRRIGATRLAAWLKARGARNSATVAQMAVAAAQAQRSTLPIQAIGAKLVAKLAAEITAIDEELKQIDLDIASRFERHRSAEILTSMPGFGPVLAATFLAQIGGNLDGFDSVGRLACVAGLAPVPRDSGRISGNLHRPRRFNRRPPRTRHRQHRTGSVTTALRFPRSLATEAIDSSRSRANWTPRRRNSSG
ncbi:IS110 family transposase [Mycolicibacterium cyprinidarum]|uniref:IS110 family transposase n=1 Tax=Mycolicibacterium cyprinidarum TaxID=2860311 RepID=A0ABQ4V7W8_9MYCO|nr:IS110 family transposase [Mycolicibacterium sp. NGTWSNA01]GJF15312.1 IS110 family transposase [Mycolicibacterium sp. NGTWS0302]